MRFKGGLVAVLTATAVAGCSTSVTGTAMPGLTPVDLAALKVGAYTPEPSAYDPDIDSYDDVRLIEARRMLNYLVHPFEVDSEIVTSSNLKFMSGVDSMIGEEQFPEKYRPVAQDNNLLAGVYVSGLNYDLRNRRKLIISVLRFPTDAAGKEAADQFDRITGTPERHPVPVEGYPDARASSADDITAISFVAHGPYVIVTNTGVPQPNQAGLASNIRKTLDLQIARLDQQKPIPLDDLLDLPIDPDNIMRRALPPALDYSDPFVSKSDFGYFEPSGELHFERNPIEIQRAFEESGVDLVGRRGGIVYRTRDLAAAFRLQTALTKPGKNDEAISSPPGIPDAQCLNLDANDDTRGFNELCAVVYGRYVAVVLARTPLGTRLDSALYQRAAAQYAILAKSE
ncbi:DUF7373 family lipoprotein [Nocardia australiensis]|uniref:DUF7373 family lipoprotein n=1 Tax=Nocardia australiensis TaxID=2887191 RepID=UPI001D13E091|nr:hypothetical protein [Nocardia australiensis]